MRPTRAASCWTGQSLKCVWTLLTLPGLSAAQAPRWTSVRAERMGGSHDEGGPMLRGMATVTYFAAALNAARRWYSDLLGVEAYFEQPGNVEFRVGDYQQELGLIDSRYAPAGAGQSTVGAAQASSRSITANTSSTCPRCSRTGRRRRGVGGGGTERREAPVRGRSRHRPRPGEALWGVEGAARYARTRQARERRATHRGA